MRANKTNKRDRKERASMGLQAPIFRFKRVLRLCINGNCKGFKRVRGAIYTAQSHKRPFAVGVGKIAKKEQGFVYRVPSFDKCRF